MTRELLAGMTSVAESAGAACCYCPVPPTPPNGPARSAVRSLLRTAIARRLPLVVVDQPRPDRFPAAVAWVGVADRPAAEHVLRLGHRRLGVVSFGLAGRTEQQTAT